MWDILDFSQHDYALRWNLTDDDLCALLVVIDGRNKLKKLFLTRPEPWKSGCSNVKGCGLEPLRGSDVMVQIDIDYPYISEDVALPIIESFIENRQSSLRHISLPEHWRKNKSSNLVSFLRRYDDSCTDFVSVASNAVQGSGGLAIMITGSNALTSGTVAASKKLPATNA